MPKFTSIENLKIQALQSLIEAPTNSELVELGTKTLDNRGLWEDNNFNETTLEPYLTENNLTLRTINVDGITFLPSISNSSIFQYSIDALPFVTDPNDRNEIVRLDNYYDKEQESNKYYLATEGKINYYIYPRTSGRPTPNGHIDNYQGRQYISRFDTYADVDVKNGFYLFKLNWGDGTDIEYTDEPKLLESTILLNHNYKKPGFYTISGVVYVADLNGNIGGYERFETKILLNPSQNYELNLYDYDNFATIGGISEDSVMIKSAANLIGINPNTLNTDKSSPDIIEDVNLLDKFQLLNLLNKVSGSILDNFDELLNIEFNKYEERLAEVPEPVEEVEEEVEEESVASYQITLNEVSESNIDLINFRVISSEPYIENSEIELVVYFVNTYDHSPFDVQLRPFITTSENLDIELIEDNLTTFDETEYRNARYRFIMPNQDVEITATAFISTIRGCMDINADNYNSDANVNDNSCQYSYGVKVQGVAPYGNTQVNTTFGNNPTIPYSTLINNEQKILSANVIQDGYEFSGWEIINGENFQEGTIQLSSVLNPQTILTISQTANPNNYGIIVVRANFIQTTDGGGNNGDAGGNTGGGNTGGGNAGGGNAGGGKAPGDDDVELPGDNEVDQYGGGVS